MSIANTLAGEGTPDVDGFMDVDQAIKPAPVVVQTLSAKGTLETPMTPDLQQQILNPSNPVEILHNNVREVIEMGEISDELEKKKTISFADAEAVNLVFENFKNKFSVNEFTSLPSRTGYQEVTRFLKKEVQLRKEGLQTEFQNFLEQPFADLKDYYDKLRASTKNLDLPKRLMEFSAEANLWMANKSAVNEQGFLHGQEVVNFATEALDKLPDIHIDKPNVERFVKAYKNVLQMWVEEKGFRNLLNTVLARELMHLQNATPSLREVLALFASSTLPEHMVQLEKTAEDGWEQLGDILRGFKGNPSEFTLVRNFLVEQQEALSQSAGMVYNYIQQMAVLHVLFVNMSIVLDFFQV